MNRSDRPTAPRAPASPKSTAARPAVAAELQTEGLPLAARPSLRLLGTEPWRAAGELLHLAVARRPQAPAGDGHPVIIFPGLASDGHAVAPLRRFCRSLGYQALDWGRGFNTGPRGDVDDWLQALASHVDELVREHGQVPSLIGWSLGGLYARELAKLPGARVRQVITIGTPFNGTPQQTHVGWLYRLLNRAGSDNVPTLRERLRTPPPVPTTSIYSRRDGVVAWQACTHDREGPRVEDIEVDGSHLGMGWNPRVLSVVADRLAQRPQAWRRYQPAPPRAGRTAAAEPAVQQA